MRQNNSALIEVLAGGGFLLSGFLFLSATFHGTRLAQSISLIGLSVSTGCFVSASRRSHQDEEMGQLRTQLRQQEETLSGKEIQLSTLAFQLSEANQQLKAAQNRPTPIDRTSQIIAECQQKLATLQNRYRAELERVKAEERTQRQLEVDSLRAEMVDSDTRIREFEQRFVDRAQATLSEALQRIYDRVTTLINEQLRRLGDPEAEDYDRDFAERLSSLSDEADVLHENYVQQIGSLATFLDADNILDCSDEALSILFHLMDGYTTIKVKVINALKGRIIQSLQATIQAYQAAELIPKAQLEQLQQNLRARLQEYDLEAAQHQENAIAVMQEYEAQTQEDERVVRGYIDKLAALEHENYRLKEEIAAAKALKRFHPGSWAWGADIGNSVIDYLMAQNIPCDAIPLDFTPSDTHLTLSLECRTEIGLEMLRKEADKIQKGMEAAKGWADVKLDLEGRIVKVKVQFAKRAIAKVKPESVLKRPLSDWQLYLGSELHWAVFAATQSGKTTLIDELDALLYTLFDGEVEFNAITLKTDGNRDEEKKKRFVLPQFKQDSILYYEAMGEVEEEIESRKKILLVNPQHHYKRSVYQWDEYGEHYRNGGIREATKRTLISALQVGAGLSSENGKGIQITFVAQNPLVSQLGLNRPDLANCCLIVVGEKNIRLFLGSDSDNHGLDPEDLARLKEELSAYKKASREAVEKIVADSNLTDEEKRLAIAKCPEKYYSLIIPSKGGLKPIVLYNPKPGDFTNPLTGEPVKDVTENCEHDFEKTRTRLIENKTKRQRELVCKKCKFKKKEIEPIDPSESKK